MECIFCKIAAGEIPADVVYRDDEVTAFRDINPQAPTHVLIIPNEHVPDVFHATEEQLKGLPHMVSVANQLAEREHLAERGYRLVINHGPDAGQSVFHLHMHLLGGRRFSWPPG